MKLQNIKIALEGEPKFRYKQVYKAVYQELISDWTEASSLPKTLRDKLQAECPLEIEATTSIAPDGTEKALLTLEDGEKIETVLIKHDDGRSTVCVSSQVGCPMGCLFCATGQLGFKRNLTRDEIVMQVLFFARRLKLSDQKVTNVVYMGMGEPFLNYDAVIASINFMHDPEIFNMGARRFSISTAGVPSGIKKLAGEKLEINLAMSLHAPNDILRSRIMPISRQYPLETVLKEIRGYLAKTNRRVMFEYLMIDDMNDSPTEARALAKLLGGMLGYVNLISYNATGAFRPSTSEKIKRFKQILQQEKIAATERHRFGEGIDAACGQLAAKDKSEKGTQPHRFAGVVSAANETKPRPRSVVRPHTAKSMPVSKAKVVVAGKPNSPIPIGKGKNLKIFRESKTDQKLAKRIEGFKRVGVAKRVGKGDSKPIRRDR